MREEGGCESLSWDELRPARVESGAVPYPESGRKGLLPLLELTLELGHQIGRV